MSIKDPILEGEQLCTRQSLKFISARRDGQNIIVRAVSRATGQLATFHEHGEIWVIRFDEHDEHKLSERLLRFDLTAVGNGTNPDIPFCIIQDVCKLYDYMRDRKQQRGLAVDPSKYGGVQ